jgi:hypothetical protein
MSEGGYLKPFLLTLEAAEGAVKVFWGGFGVAIE